MSVIVSLLRFSEAIVVVKSKIMENGSMHACHIILNDNYAYNDPTNLHAFFAYSSPNEIICCFPIEFSACVEDIAAHLVGRKPSV